MNAAGIEGDLVYFVIEDYFITESSFYALIDSLVASGEVNVLKQQIVIRLFNIRCFRFQEHTATKK
jgi:hypothetical protein